jgi:hypothetical protein
MEIFDVELMFSQMRHGFLSIIRTTDIGVSKIPTHFFMEFL